MGTEKLERVDKIARTVNQKLTEFHSQGKQYATLFLYKRAMRIDLISGSASTIGFVFMLLPREWATT